MESPMAAADVGAVLNNRGGGWGDGWYGIIGLMVIAGMFGGFGGWGNRGGNAVTEADLCNANSFNELKSQVGRMNDQQASIARQTDNAICNLGYTALQNTNAIQTQLAECCCDLRREIAAEGSATRAMLQQDKIEAMAAKINKLERDQALQGVIRYPQGFCYSAANPYFGFGNSGCSCNNTLF